MVKRFDKKKWQKPYMDIYNPMYYLKHRDKIIKQTKLWKEKNIGKIRIRKRILARKYRKMYPEIMKARMIAVGIPKHNSCDICGSNIKLERHHWRYDKPKLVNTLCKRCHDIQHSRNVDNAKELLLGGKIGI